MYSGQYVNCHSQAICECLLDKYNLNNMVDFEIATTVSFGVSYNKDDPKRIFDLYLDPDIGINRALEYFRVSYREQFFGEYNDFNKALELLTQWLNYGEVLLGPLEMGKLDYLFDKQLYNNIDHYVVALNWIDGLLLISDPEYFPHVLIHKDILRMAWSGNGIKEGRGHYTIRQVLHKKNYILLEEHNMQGLIYNCVRNMQNAEAVSTCGSKGIKLLYNDIGEIAATKSYRNELIFQFTVRLQRCYLNKIFMDKIMLYRPNNICCKYAKAVKNDLTLQMHSLNTLIHNLKFKVEYYESLLVISDCESQILDNLQKLYTVF